MYSESEFERRFAVVSLMDYYIDDDYINLLIDYYSGIKSEQYYVNMAAAWALSVCFVKYPDLVLPLLENNVLTKEIHNMMISKIRDSLRVDKETKSNIKELKRS